MRFAYLIEPPFNFISPAGLVTGADVELAKRALAASNAGDVEFVEAEFAELLPGLDAGRWDMTTGLFVTPERQRQAVFSRPIWSLSDGLLIPRGNPRSIRGLGTFASNSDLRLAVIAGQVQQGRALAAGVRQSSIAVFATYGEAAKAVAAGKAAAYLNVALAHSGFLAQSGDQRFEMFSLPSDQSNRAVGAFGFALSNASLRDKVDLFLEAYIGCTEHLHMLRSFGMESAVP